MGDTSWDLIKREAAARKKEASAGKINRGTGSYSSSSSWEAIKREAANRKREKLFENYGTDLKALSDRIMSANEWQDAETMRALKQDTDAMLERTRSMAVYSREKGLDNGIEEILAELESASKGIVANAGLYSAYRDYDNWKSATDSYKQDYETYAGKLPSEIQKIAEEKYAERDSQLSAEVEELK